MEYLNLQILPGSWRYSIN